jgi:quercetin dioxygenase-like cupin family protein
MMITRRDITIAVGTVAITLGAVAVHSQNSVMTSTAVDWNSMSVRTTNVGEVRQVFRNPTLTLEELECHITTVKAHMASHAPHQHPNEEMVIIKEGTVEVLVNGEWKKVSPGSIVFFSSNQLHGLRNVGDTPATYHVINFRTAATPKKQPSQ